MPCLPTRLRHALLPTHTRPGARPCLAYHTPTHTRAPTYAPHALPTTHAYTRPRYAPGRAYAFLHALPTRASVPIAYGALIVCGPCARVPIVHGRESGKPYQSGMLTLHALASYAWPAMSTNKRHYVCARLGRKTWLRKR